MREDGEDTSDFLHFGAFVSLLEMRVSFFFFFRRKEFSTPLYILSIKYRAIFQRNKSTIERKHIPLKKREEYPFIASSSRKRSEEHGKSKKNRGGEVKLR